MSNPLTYFILTRSIFNSPIWSDDPHVLKLFIYLIGNARHKKESKRYPGFEIKRGELVTSLNQIAEDNQFLGNGILKRWSKQKVSRMLKILIDQEYISLLSDTYGTHININHYDTYQDPSTYKSDGDGTGVEQVWNESGTGVGTNNKDNNVNNEKNVKKKDIEVKTSKFNRFSFIKNYFKDLYTEELESAIKDHMTVRDKKKCVSSERSMKSYCKDLKEHSQGCIETMIAIVDKSSNKGYPDLYPLGGNNGFNNNQQKTKAEIYKEHSEEQDKYLVYKGGKSGSFEL